MAEWSMAAVLKTVDRKVRGFESCSLRHLLLSEIISLVGKGEMAEWSKAIAC